MSRRVTVASWAATLAVAACLVVLVLNGCGGGGTGDRTGRLQVALTDQTGTYANVFLSIREIRLVQLGQGGAATGQGLPVVPIPNPPHVVDVLTLQYQYDLLGGATVPAGRYRQVRLVLDPNPAGQDPVNYLTLPADTTQKIPINTPSGQQSGLKVLGEFEVAAGLLNTIVLEFAPERAIVQAGNSGQYNFKPTGIRIMQTEGLPTNLGAIVGAVEPQAAWADATIEVIPENGTVPILTGGVDPDYGAFRAVLPAGEYKVQVTAPDYEPLTSGPHTVDSQADTGVGTLTLTPTST